MIARGSDYRYRPPVVTLEMTLAEFREHVEWLEELASHDGCTRDWRATLDRIAPGERDDKEDA